MASSATQLHSNAYAYHNEDVAKKYASSRPSYPTEAIDYIKNELGLSKDSVIVDLAAGTGKFTQLLAKAGFKNITAVEPSPEFRNKSRELLEKIKKEEQPDLEFKVIEGLSTSIPAQDNSVDFLCSAQAFHWFANEESIKEINRVLKPNGILLLIWNIYDEEENKEMASMVQLFRGGKTELGSNLMTSPHSGNGQWKEVFANNENNEEFKKLINPILEKKVFKYSQITNIENTLTVIQSMSFIAILPQEKKDQLLEKMRSVMNAHEFTKDNKDFTLVYKTEMYITRKPNN